jgi:hypothetical protein
MNPYRVLLFSSIILFMLIVLLVGLNWGDEAPPEDADLWLAPGVIAESENGYPLLAEALRIYERSPDAIRASDLPSDGSHDDWLRGELEKNKEALRLLAQAIERPEILLPELDTFGVREGLGEIREMIRLVSARGQVALRDPSIEPQQMDDFLLALRMGRLMAEGGGSLIDLLTSIAIQGMALEALRKESHQLRLNPEETRQLLRALQDEEISRDAWIRNLQGEYTHTRKVLDVMFAHSSAGSPWYENLGYVAKPNKTVRIIGEEYRAILDLVREPIYPQEGWPEEEMTLPGSLPLENSVGRVIAGISIPSLTRVIRAGFLHEAHSGNRRLILALSAFEKVEGHLPDRLEELVGTWIDELPVDPFSGEPPRYSKPHRMVFTIGPELNSDPDTVATSGRELRGFIVAEPQASGHGP